MSIVNWIRGDAPGPHTLATQLGDSPASPWRHESLPRIPASLRAGVDVAGARPLAACAAPFCYEGLQPGHRGFRLSAAEARRHLPAARPALSPYMTGGALLSGEYQRRPEYLIDLPSTLAEAANHPDLLAHLERTVVPDWRRDAAAERARTGKPTGEHQNRLTTWWQLKRPRPELQAALRRLSRYIACARVTRRPIFAFLDPTIKPDSSLTVFAAEDDYSFGLLQSQVHWAWFQGRCSTLKRDHRYTSNTVFDSFPWPQSPSLSDLTAVAAAAAALRTTRTILIRFNNHHSQYHNLRDLYRAAEAGECDQLLIMQQALDRAVRAAYGMPLDADPLAFLLALNHELAARESRGLPITAPGLPPAVDPRPFITDDRITP
ncbi:MAG: hypothetical protein JNL82_00805 [Myxococcales bacterium]|nr:hypothetical protein [Myxococcales bacterium]